MKQRYSGGCHCGAVRYEVDLDLSLGTFRCNCSMCGKTRAWLAAVSDGDFHLLRGEDALTEYQFAAKKIHHLFCKHCGVKSFGRGPGPDGGEMAVIAVSCLENVPDAELAAAPVTYFNGREDDFQTPPAETRHL